MRIAAVNLWIFCGYYVDFERYPSPFFNPEMLPSVLKIFFCFKKRMYVCMKVNVYVCMYV